MSEHRKLEVNIRLNLCIQFSDDVSICFYSTPKQIAIQMFEAPPENNLAK